MHQKGGLEASVYWCCCADGSTKFEVGALDIVWSHRAAGPYRPPRPKVSRGVRADYTCLATDFLWDPLLIVQLPNNYLSGWSTTQDGKEAEGGCSEFHVNCILTKHACCLLGLPLPA